MISFTNIPEIWLFHLPLSRASHGSVAQVDTGTFVVWEETPSYYHRHKVVSCKYVHVTNASFLLFGKVTTK